MYDILEKAKLKGRTNQWLLGVRSKRGGGDHKGAEQRDLRAMKLFCHKCVDVPVRIMFSRDCVGGYTTLAFAKTYRTVPPQRVNIIVGLKRKG